MGIRQSSKILFTMKIPGDRQLDDYRVTLKMTRIVEEVIREYPDNWLWFQHRWNTPYTPTGKEQEHVEK